MCVCVWMGVVGRRLRIRGAADGADTRSRLVTLRVQAQFCFAICFLRRLLERGPQGRDGHGRLWAPKQFYFGQSAEGARGLRWGACAADEFTRSRRPLSVGGTLCPDLWNIPQLVFQWQESFLELAYKLAKVSSSGGKHFPRCRSRMTGGGEDDRRPVPAPAPSALLRGAERQAPVEKLQAPSTNMQPGKEHVSPPRWPRAERGLGPRGRGVSRCTGSFSG